MIAGESNATNRSDIPFLGCKKLFAVKDNLVITMASQADQYLSIKMGKHSK